MNILSLTLKNFRSFKESTKISFDNLTAFVGPNDIGKSSVLEALDIFFNDSRARHALETSDINVYAAQEGDTTIEISVEFNNLPSDIVIDETYSTTLGNEHLLTLNETLLIKKVYPNAGKPKIYITANHPVNPGCEDLLYKKINELKSIIKDLGLPKEKLPDLTKKAEIRQAIWNHYSDSLDQNVIDIDTCKEDAKNIWEKLNQYMPVYSLFQSDRSNSDTDKEVQDPLKEAVKIIMHDEEVQSLCEQIATKVNGTLQRVADKTRDKIREMQPDVAKTLSPSIPSNSDLKWVDVFKNVSITGDNNIPLNKRGSGVRRLILLSFFRAQAEETQQDTKAPGIIYAIEEPETSQHFLNQESLINALIELSENDNVQVIITTHSGTIVKHLSYSNLRLVYNEGTEKKIKEPDTATMPYQSLNEINYNAFGMATEEFHDELYSYLEHKQWLNDFISGKPTYQYIQVNKDGSQKKKQLTKTEIIRHQIHHADNTYNTKYTKEELNSSIELMRQFIASKQVV